MSLIPGEAPLDRAPTIDRRGLVPWLSVNDRELLAGADFGMHISLAAASICDAHYSQALRMWIRDGLGLGLALHPQLDLLQLDSDFIDTRKESDRIKLLRNRALLREAVGTLDLARRISEIQARESSAGLLQLAVNAMGTALIAGTFTFLRPDPRMLAINLALLDGAAAEFDAEQLRESVDRTAKFWMPRQLFAGVSIDVRLLDQPRFLTRLLEELLERGENFFSYWIQVPGLRPGVATNKVRVLSDFLYALQERSAKGVIADRLGTYGLGYLAGGLAGMCLGTSAPEYASFPPSGYWPAELPGAKPRSFSLVGYNHVLLRNFILSGKHASIGHRAFHKFPCDRCDGHDPGKEPRTPRERKLHGFYWHRRQAAELSIEVPAVTSRRFREMVAEAAAGSEKIESPTRLYAGLLETLPPAAHTQAETGSD